MLPLYIIITIIFLYYVLVSVPFGGSGFSSLSMSSGILALLRTVEGDINDGD